MGRRDKRQGKKLRYAKIAVFALQRGSQFNPHVYNDKCYDFVMRVIDDMMYRNDVESDKVGISGYKGDVVAYIAGLIHLYITSNIDFILMDDLHEYDPDLNVPNNYDC